jgi:hypothetical protein
MRVTLLTTVAAVTLSLSVAAVAQTGGAAGGSSGGSGAATGGAGATTGGAGATTSPGAGGASGGAAGATTSGGAATSGAASGAGTAAPAAGGAAGTSGGGGAAVTLAPAQRTQAVETLRSVNIQPVQENITVTVGQTLPTSVTRLVDCPPTLVSLITGVRDCKVVLIGSRYYIVEGSSRRVVTTIER